MPVGPDLPENQEIIDISGEKMKMLASFPTPPEPHDATFMAVSVLKPMVHQTYTPADDAVQAGKERVVRTAPHAVTVDMTLIRSAYTPDSFQVREGDQVTLKITNVETIRDMIHGFALPDHNLNIALAPGYTKTITFDAGKPGVYWFYCTNFCSALHLEMRGRMVVQPKDFDRHADGLARGRERQGPGRPRRAVDRRPASEGAARSTSRPPRSRRRRWCCRCGASRCRRRSIPDETLHLQVQREPGSSATCTRSRRCSITSASGFRRNCRSCKWATRGHSRAGGAAAARGLRRRAAAGGRVYRVVCAVALVLFLVASAAVVQARLYQVGHDRDPNSPLRRHARLHAAARRPGESRQFHGLVVSARRRACCCSRRRRCLSPAAERRCA